MCFTQALSSVKDYTFFGATSILCCIVFFYPDILGPDPELGFGPAATPSQPEQQQQEQTAQTEQQNNQAIQVPPPNQAVLVRPPRQALPTQQDVSATMLALQRFLPRRRT